MIIHATLAAADGAPPSVTQALVLGLLQGLAEFLPISSSAHLALAPWALGWPDPGLAFDVALHFGTLVAVLWYFRREWIMLLRAALEIVTTRRASTTEQRRVIFLLVATVPGALAGLALERAAESTFRNPAIIGVALIAMGIALWLVDRYVAQRRHLTAMRMRDAVLIGVSQAFAIVPGFSRSGMTIMVGRALSFDREGAARFSFLMSMPIIAGAALLKVPHVIRAQGLNGSLLVGVLAAAISGWLAISVLLRFVSRHSYGAFAVYRVVLGLGVIALFLARGGG